MSRRLRPHRLMSLLATSAAALALALAAGSARASAPINASLSFDNVASGATANTALGALVSVMRFANPEREDDIGPNGLTGTFHWVDATSVYGDVPVRASAAAVSGANVLSNQAQPIMLVFAAPVNIASFSVQQDLSGFGNPQAGGVYLAFLDATGHEMAAASLQYTQAGQPGLTIGTSGRVDNVSAILLPAGSDYDNLQLTAVAAVPEPATVALWAGGLGCVAAVARRRKGVGC